VSRIALILSFLFIALAAKPCVDGPVLSQSRSEITAGHDTHEHSADLCSPFCSCACCGVHILNYLPQQNFEVSAFADFAQKPVSLYRTPLVSGYFGSIWQPPQLS